MKEFLSRECGKEVCYVTLRQPIHQLGVRLSYSDIVAIVFNAERVFPHKATGAATLWEEAEWDLKTTFGV